MSFFKYLKDKVFLSPTLSNSDEGNKTSINTSGVLAVSCAGGPGEGGGDRQPESNYHPTKIMNSAVSEPKSAASSPGSEDTSNHNGTRKSLVNKKVTIPLIPATNSSTTTGGGGARKSSASRSPTCTDWRLNLQGQGVISKWEYVLENKLFTDVTFLVGPDQEIIKCHSLVLKMQSKHLQHMLTADKEHKGDFEFEVPNCSASVFRKMLKYLYTDKLEFGADDAMDALVIARQYHLTALQAKCGRIVLEGINQSNAALLLKKAEDMGDKQLSIKVQEYILQHANQVLFTPAFKEISIASLVKLLQANRALWKMTEVRILEAVKLWASAECDRQSLENSGPNQYTVAKAALDLIHFTSFTPMQFTSEVVKPKLLPSDKMLEIQSELIEREESTKSGYSGSVPHEHNEDDELESKYDPDELERSSTPTSGNSGAKSVTQDTLSTADDIDQVQYDPIYTLSRYSMQSSKDWRSDNEDGIYKISFQSSKPVTIVGLTLYGHRDGASALVDTCIKFTSYDEQIVHLEFETKSNLPENGGEFEVKLLQPLQINKMEWYTIMIAFNGRVYPSGIGGKRAYTIETSNGESVTFNFRNSKHISGASHVRGQLPQILFSVPHSFP